MHVVLIRAQGQRLSEGIVPHTKMRVQPAMATRRSSFMVHLTGTSMAMESWEAAAVRKRTKHCTARCMMEDGR